MILDRLEMQKHRSSTKNNYLVIWRKFNQFLIRLDWKPNLWEKRTALFCAYLVDNGFKSATVKSYVSAIKSVLKSDGYMWDDRILLLDSIIRACRLINDRVYQRRPIQKGLLELILFEIERLFTDQYYLEIMFKAMFSLSYYGLLWVGELAAENIAYKSNHAVRAANVHVGQNKPKIMVVLYSSKTHGLESLPQKIKIAGVGSNGSGSSRYEEYLCKTHFCPFAIVQEYMRLLGDYDDANEQFFVFKHGVLVRPAHVRQILKLCLDNIGLHSSLYDMHSTRAGRAIDLVKAGFLVSEVKVFGRWRSNAVYHYLKN